MQILYFTYVNMLLFSKKLDDSNGIKKCENTHLWLFQSNRFQQNILIVLSVQRIRGIVRIFIYWYMFTTHGLKTQYYNIYNAPSERLLVKYWRFTFQVLFWCQTMDSQRGKQSIINYTNYYTTQHDVYAQ